MKAELGGRRTVVWQTRVYHETGQVRLLLATIEQVLNTEENRTS